MDNRLSGKTEIWADGYSFMEISETLMVALGLRSEERKPSEPSSGLAEVDSPKAEEACPAWGFDR